MAVVVSGELNIHNGSSYDWYLVWVATYTGAVDNKWDIDLTFEVRKTGANNETHCTGETRKIGIAGDIDVNTWTFDMRSASVGTKATIYTKSKTLSCNADGSIAAVALYGYYDASSTTVGLVEGTKSLALPTQPRMSIIDSVANFNIEDGFYVLCTKNNAAFHDLLSIKYGAVTITRDNYISNTKIVLTDAEILQFYKAIPINDLTAVITFELETQDASHVKIGTSSVTAVGKCAGTVYIGVGGNAKRGVVYIGTEAGNMKGIAYIGNDDNVAKRGV
jgi:hypothetical protein